MLNFETRGDKPPIFFDLVASPADRDRFDITMCVFRKGEATTVERIATVDWCDLGHVLSNCRVALETRGYWQVEDHDFVSAPVVERAAA